MNNHDRTTVPPLVPDIMRAVLVGAIFWITAEVSLEPASALPGSSSLALAAILAILQFGQRHYPVGVLTVSVIALTVYNGSGAAAVAPVWPLLIPLGFAASAGKVAAASSLAAMVVVTSGLWRALVEGEATVSVLVGEVQGAIVAGLALAVGEAIWQRRRWAEEVSKRLAEQRKATMREAEHRITEERMAAAADLHDVSGNSMVLIGLHLQRAREAFTSHDLDESRSAVQAALEAHEQAMLETTRTVQHLRNGFSEPVALLADGHLDLTWLEERVASAGLVLDTNILPVGSLSADIALALHRVIREAATNTFRHAAAKRISVDMHADMDGIHLCFADDGRGTSQPGGTSRGGTGLQGLCDRIERLGGRLTTSTPEDGGFTVHAWIPRENQA